MEMRGLQQSGCGESPEEGFAEHQAHRQHHQHYHQLPQAVCVNLLGALEQSGTPGSQGRGYRDGA
jgi:hypothetical protein